MQIFCPKCATGYEIDDKLLQDKPRKFKCSSCGEVFVVDKNTVAQEEENPFEQLAAAMEDDKNTIAETGDSGEVAISESEEVKIVEEEPIAEVKEIPAESVAEVNKEEQKSEPAPEVKESAKTDEVKSEAEVASATPEPNTNTADEDKDVNAVEEEIDIEDIFERLSERTENLINDEKKLPITKKIRFWFKNLFGLGFGVKWRYIGIGAAVIAVIWLFNNRYEVVRKVPFTHGIYKVFGITAKIPGEGLEFQNINWDLIAQEDGNQLEIRGFVFNNTDKPIKIPTVHVEILDRETSMLQSQNTLMENSEVEPQEKVALNISIPNAAPTMKYVYMTFIDVD